MVEPEGLNKGEISEEVSNEPVKYEIPPIGTKIVPPPGMSKNAFKKLLRQQKWEASKEAFLNERREKRRALKARKKQEGTLHRHKRAPAEERRRLPGKIIIDCGFDDLMDDKQRVSLSQQLTRCYAENKNNKLSVDLEISSFDKKLKERFEGALCGHHKYWKEQDCILNEEEFAVPQDPAELSRMIYLSSDSDNVLDDLDENLTVIIGGIVDKGKEVNLCKNKAEKLGIKTARLPLDELIKLHGRRVLTTNHVFELILSYYDCKNWATAFERVLPQRKFIRHREDSKDESDSSEKADDDREDGIEVKENTSAVVEESGAAPEQ